MYITCIKIKMNIFRQHYPCKGAYQRSKVILYNESHKKLSIIKSRDRNAGQNNNLKRGNTRISFKRLEQFKYLETTLKNQNSIHEEIKSRLKSGNACYLSVQNILSSNFVSQNAKIKM
jgi:hypothetical protein